MAMTPGLSPSIRQVGLGAGEPSDDHDVIIEMAEEGEDPCTSGYEQYGMKDGDDGRPVPNCIPIKE